MSKGFDCATPLNAKKAALFSEQGFKFVGRYLAEVESWKRLTPTEANLITAAGLYIVSFFERAASRAREGADAGKEDGRLALQLALEVGQPTGSAIYATVDYDAPITDFDQIEAYMRAFDVEIVGYELGVYGSYSVVKAMYERGVATKIMQTYAWSRGNKFDPISIYQYENDVIDNGVGIDRDESNGDAGGWKVGMSIKQKAMLESGVANTIINTWLSSDWMKAQAAGAEDQADYIHWLANQLRVASGQPEE